jgi:hypothetical protein
MTEGVDPMAFMHQLAGRLDQLDLAEVERAMDDLEYLGEVLDPEFQDLSEELMARLQSRLELLRR